jgi:hypothetical protein
MSRVYSVISYKEWFVAPLASNGTELLAAYTFALKKSRSGRHPLPACIRSAFGELMQHFVTSKLHTVYVRMA